MYAFTIFLAVNVVAMTASFFSPYAFLALGILTAVFPVLMAWIFLRPRPRTAMLLFWVTTLTSANFAAAIGGFLSVSGTGAAAGMAIFFVLCGFYVARLTGNVRGGHASSVRLWPQTLMPTDDSE